MTKNTPATTSIALCPNCQEFDYPETHICLEEWFVEEDPSQEHAIWTPETIDEFLAG